MRGAERALARSRIATESMAFEAAWQRMLRDERRVSEQRARERGREREMWTRGSKESAT